MDVCFEERICKRLFFIPTSKVCCGLHYMPLHEKFGLTDSKGSIGLFMWTRKSLIPITATLGVTLCSFALIVTKGVEILDFGPSIFDCYIFSCFII